MRNGRTGGGNGPEIGVDDIEVNKCGRSLPVCVQGEVDGDLCLAAAVIAGQDDKPAAFEEFCHGS